MLIIIPARNEAATLPEVLDAVRRVSDAPVLVVDDGSEDDTRWIALRAPGVHVLRHERSLGYGQALLDGFAWAEEHRHAVAITLDADLQHEAADLPAFAAAIETCDIASGTRYHTLSAVSGVAPSDRMQLNLDITSILSRITGWPLTDSFCGYKAYRVPAVRALGCRVPGYAMPLELWIRAWATGLVVHEVPTARIYRPVERNFDGLLDDVTRRRCHYLDVIRRTLVEVGRGDAARSVPELATLPRCRE